MPARQERGRVHGGQPSRARVADHDCLHAVDSVHADDVGVCHHRKPTPVCVRGSAEASPRALRRSRVAGTQHDEHAPAVPHGVDSRGERGSAATGHDEVDGSGHVFDDSDAHP